MLIQYITRKENSRESCSDVFRYIIFLFTNIPLELIIEGINSRSHCIQEETKILKMEFTIGVQFILNSTSFIFDNVIYKQIFGTSMGSPLSPILVDIVMQDLEEKARV